MRIGIIGAGATGLAAAYNLSKTHDVLMFEEGDIGGLAGAAPLGDTFIDKFYHHIFTNDTSILRYIDEFGLGEKMIWKPANNGLYLGSKLYPFTNPIDLLLFPKVSLLGRLRMGFTVLGAKRIRDFSEMETVSAKEWITNKAGRSAYTALWEPLLYSKFDNDADNVSGVWIWNKFKLRGSTRQGVSKEYLGYLEGGFISLYKKMAENIPILSETVTGIEPKGNKLLLTTDVRVEAFDKILFTAAAEKLSHICKFDESYQKRLLAQKHKANICVTLILRKPISSYYWITVAEKDAPFVLMIEHTNLFDNSDYKGSKVVYLSRYLDVSNPLFIKSDSQIRDEFLIYLKKMFPAFDEDDISDWRVCRETHAQPVVYMRHRENILPFETPIAGLHLANMGQIYPEDRGQNYAIRLGEDVAKMIGGHSI
ncbi:MAG: FAD-dependent oxidoreductase [Oscillospiraceae bacterium]|nr:FAD-dependent oxidoreductase [Oscillospiraceae bacterium]